MRILVCEDNRDLNTLIKRTLEKNGYAVDSCLDGEEGYYYAREEVYDCLILDVMMPKTDGFTLLKKIRDQGISTPVLFLTAKDSIDDKVYGLDSGADDYLVKPFEFDELLARIRVLTRKSAGISTEEYTLADLRLNPKSHSAMRGNREIPLLSKEYSLLEYMIRNKGVVLSTTQLEDAIWSFEEGGSSNNIAVYISKLRKKIDEGEENKLLHTLRGVGYVLREDLK